MLKKLIFLFTATGSLLALQGRAQKLPEGIEKVTSVEGITEYRIKKNGMKVLLFPDASKPTVTVNITYLVGSRNEGYGETGMSHLLEHMVFKGTPKHPNIPEELTKHGARPNGTTWYDRTNYFETFSATDENLNWALSLESDRMVNSYIAKKDLESEMTVVRNEFESGENDPSSILLERAMSTAFLWHNYGKSTIGARADIEKVPIERLQAYYHKYYQPDNSVLLVAGKIDEAKTLGLILNYFENIPLPDRTKDNKLYTTYTEEPVQDGEREVVLKRVGDVQVASALYHIPAGPHPDYAPVEVLANLLTDQPSGRLYKTLVETKLASSEGGYSFALKEPGVMYFAAEVTKDKSLDSAKNALLTTLDNTPAQPFTKEEVDRIQQKLLKDWELNFTNVETVGLELSEFICQGDWRLAFLYRDALKKVSLNDVMRVASAYMKPSNRTVGIFMPDQKPDRAIIPPTPDVAALVKDYKGGAALASGEAFDPSTNNIEARTKRGSVSNSIQYALLPKQTRGNTVNAQLTLRIGDENSLKNKATIASLTAAMLNKGTATKSRQQIADALDKLKAKVSFAGSGAAVVANIETTKENFPEVLKLVTEILKTPSFPKDEFEKLVQENVAAIEGQKSDPVALASLEYQRMINPYPKDDIRYTPTFDESLAALKAVTADDVKKFYQNFYGASSATVGVVGAFDEAETKKQIETAFGNWKNPTPYKRIASTYTAVPGTAKSINTPDKANAMFIAGMNINLNDSDPDYPAMVLANYIFGGGFLNSRLATRIRQKEGISYGVGSQMNASPLDKKGVWLTYAIYAPQNAAKLEAAFKEEIEKVRKDGFTKEELESAKSGLLQSRQVTRSQDPALAAGLSNYLFLNRTYQWDAKLEEAIKNLTPEQVNAAFKKYIDPTKINYVKAGEFEKAKETKPF